MSGTVGCSERFLCALFARVVKPITDLRLLISGLCALLLAPSFPAQAQQPARVPRIAFLSVVGSAQQPYIEAFRQGLRELGYIEGKNIVIEWRHAGDRREQLPNLAVELSRLQIDLIVASRTPSIHAAKQTTKMIPIVMVGASDPVGTGLVASLARPEETSRASAT